MNRPLRLATFAVPLSGNKGSASMFLGLRDAFTTAGIDAHFEVFSYYPRRDAAHAARFSNVTVHPGHPKHILVLLAAIVIHAVIPALVPGKWRRAVTALRQSDVVLLVGGTTFADSMLYKSPWNLLAALPGYWLRRPTVFLSQTIGPVTNSLNRLMARWTLTRARDVHGRGRTSESWVRRIGIEHCSYQPDLSFSMSVPRFQDLAADNEVAAAFRDRVAAAKGRCIGVAPNSIVHTKAGKVGKDYVAFLVGVVRTIHARGYLPILIPHSYRDDISQVHNNDRSLCLAVLDRLPDDVDVHYVDADLGSAELRAMIGELQLLVASRFHSMISALSMGVPPLTYGWGDHKYLEVLEEFGMTDLYASFEALDADAFAARLPEVLEQRDALSARIREAYATIEAQSRSVPRIILESIPETAAAAPAAGRA